MFRGTYLMPRTSDPTVRYLPPFSNPHETRRRRVSNIAICPPTLPTLFNLPILHTYYSPVFSLSHLPPPPSIHPPIQPSNPIQSNPTLPIPFLSTTQNHAPPPRNKTPPHNRRHNRLRAQKSPTRRTTSAANTTKTRNPTEKFLRGKRRRVSASES